MAKKATIVSSFQDKNHSIIVFEFKGEQFYLSHEEVEDHLSRYFAIREKLANEKKLRKEQESLKEAWEHYQFLLRMVR